MDSQHDTRPAVPQVDDEDDVEGHAFKWQVVTEKDGGKKLRAGWTPDEPQKPNAATSRDKQSR